MKWTCCKCEDQIDQDDMDTEERMCYDCLDGVKEEFEETEYENQCYKCNQSFKHIEILDTIAVSTGENSFEEVVYCKKCKEEE